MFLFYICYTFSLLGLVIHFSFVISRSFREFSYFEIFFASFCSDFRKIHSFLFSLFQKFGEIFAILSRNFLDFHPRKLISYQPRSLQNSQTFISFLTHGSSEGRFVSQCHHVCRNCSSGLLPWRTNMQFEQCARAHR